MDHNGIQARCRSIDRIYYHLLAVTGASSEGFVWNPGTRMNAMNLMNLKAACAVHQIEIHID